MLMLPQEYRNKVIIANPSGNITAIVTHIVPPEEFVSTAKRIQTRRPEIEQVLFVQDKNGSVYGRMAGGEFCGNAARALGYLMTEGRDACASFFMSGISSSVTVKTAPEHAALILSMCVEYEEREVNGISVPIIHLEGISHALISSVHPPFQGLIKQAWGEDVRTRIMNLITELGLEKKTASGVMLVDSEGDENRITPYVYVRASQSLYAETACASGSIAVAYKNFHAGSCADYSAAIVQPNNERLSVLLRQHGERISVELSGSMGDYDLVE